MADLGTVKQQYGKNWIYVNPDALKGPDTWNVAAIPFTPDGCIDFVQGIPPIYSEQVNGSVDLEFSINNLLHIKQGRLLGTGTDPSVGVSSARPKMVCIKNVTSDAPVVTTEVDATRVLSFSIQSLTYTSDFPDWDGNGGLPYNENRSINGVISEPPLISDLRGDEINVSFDINQLFNI